MNQKPTSGPPETGVQLSKNAVGLREVLFQSITAMAPGGAVAFALTFAASAAGGALPLSILLALIPSLMIANTVAQFAKKLPSAGGYYTYTSRGLGTQAGFMTAWAFLFYEPWAPASVYTVVGFLVQTTFPRVFGVAIPWYVWSVLGIALLHIITYIGIRFSAKTASILGSIEIVIFLALGITMIVMTPHQPGTAVLSPYSALDHHWSGVLLGMVFGIFAFTGFESAAPLAEESRNPKRTIGKAVLLAALVIGLFYFVESYAGVAGWGLGKMSGYAASSNPWNVLAHRFWGWGWVIVFLALMNSQMGNGIASQTASTRVLWAMGRIGVLPSKLSAVHHRYQTPIWAINVQTLITLILTLGTGFLFGIFNAGSFTAEVLTLAIIVVYIMGNVALPFFYWREYRKEFRWGLHVILPIIASLFLLVALYGSVFPVPAYPLNLVPYVVLVWLLIGVGVLSWLKKHRPAAVEAAKVVFLPTETESVEQGQG